mmetsp:Transcript_27051/g.49172  ORF Transcript_27051/g.49172 Transcript_27051/m.49172 type:complete len:268 (+) Transcript_27051:1979-2782(+)
MGTANVLETDVFADIAVLFERHTPQRQLVVAAHHNVLFQLETGDAIGQQTARPIIAIIDRHLDACTAQNVCRGKTAGPCANDTNRFRTLDIGLDGQDPPFFPGSVRDVFFHRTNSDGAMPGLLDHAIAFAQPVLRADPTTNLGKGIGRLAHLIGLAQPPLSRQAQPVRNVVVQGAMRLAIGHPALRTARRLLLGLGIGIFSIDFPKILPPRIRPSLGRHIPLNLYKFQHRLLSQDDSSRGFPSAGFTVSHPRRKVINTDLIMNFFWP